MSQPYSASASRRAALSAEVLTKVQARGLEGEHVSRFEAASNSLNVAFADHERSLQGLSLQGLTAAMMALYQCMRAVVGALISGGHSHLGHLGEFGIDPPSKLVRGTPLEHVRQARLLAVGLKKFTENDSYLKALVRAMLLRASVLERADVEAAPARKKQQAASFALNVAQADWLKAYRGLRRWVSFIDGETGTTMTRDIFPRRKTRKKLSLAPTPAGAPASPPATPG